MRGEAINCPLHRQSKTGKYLILGRYANVRRPKALVILQRRFLISSPLAI